MAEEGCSQPVRDGSTASFPDASDSFRETETYACVLLHQQYSKL